MMKVIVDITDAVCSILLLQYLAAEKLYDEGVRNPQTELLVRVVNTVIRYPINL